MDSSDPLVKDRGLVSNRDHETSLALHRKNSIQREQLDKELRRLDKERKECIRKTHLQKCALSRDQKCLVSDLTKFTFSDTVSPGYDGVDDQMCSDEVTKSPTATRRKVIAQAARQVVRTVARRVSLPDKLSEPGDSVATNKDKQERFIDQKVSREISKLKKASTRIDKKSKESEERKGKPRIPPNAWYHDDQNTKARERSSVFHRLSVSSNVNSMSSDQFLERVRKQRSYTVPASSSPSRTRRTERR